VSLSGVIRRKGAAVVFTWTSAGVYDPLTGATTGASTVTLAVPAMEVDGDPDLYKDLSLIETENPTLLIALDSTGVLPEMGATVPWGGDTFTVKGRKRLAMNGTPSAAFIVVGR
jgi:hypothetical protein